MIRHVIFDMGQVLIQWDPKTIIARLGLTEAKNALLLREVFQGFEWSAMDHGILTAEEGLRRIRARLPESLHSAADACVLDWWKAPLCPMPGMADLVREVRALGYDIYLLSNATSDLHRYFSRIPGSECFDGLVVSADEKAIKPQREIYEALFSRYRLKPEECYFIDDNPANIDGAFALGMPGSVFFGDMARLRSELRAAGIGVEA